MATPSSVANRRRHRYFRLRGRLPYSRRRRVLGTCFPNRMPPPVTSANRLFCAMLAPIQFSVCVNPNRYHFGFFWRFMVPYGQRGRLVRAMVRFFLVTSMVLFLVSPVLGSDVERTQPVVDLQDVLGPTVLSVPPHDGLQPLRVRQAGSKVGVDGQPTLRQNTAKALQVTIAVTKFVQEPVTLVVTEGLFLADQRGQTYVPLPARYALTEPVTTLIYGSYRYHRRILFLLLQRRLALLGNITKS